MRMSGFRKGFAAVIAAVVELGMITMAGCVRPFGDLSKPARSLLGKKQQSELCRKRRPSQSKGRNLTDRKPGEDTNQTTYRVSEFDFCFFMLPYGQVSNI